MSGIYDLCRSCWKISHRLTAEKIICGGGGIQRIPDNRTDMINRSVASRSSLLLSLLFLLASGLNACRNDRPEGEPAGTTADTAATAPPSSPIPADTAAPMPDSLGGSISQGTPGPGGTGSSPGWNRAELVQGMQRFITAIDSGDREMFWSSLSERSLNRIEKGEMGSRDEIWNTARQTLGDIQERRITVIGGTPDSVALRIDGLRMIDSTRQNDPVIVHLLHEKNDWKVMYPGLLYPMHHLRK